MNEQEQLQSKRVNVSRGIYVMLVISGIMLLLGGLISAYTNTTLNGPWGLVIVFWDLFVVFPLFAIGGILFLIGLIRLAKKMPKRTSIISLIGVGLIVGLPVIGGVIAQSPLFLGPYPLFTYNQSVNAVAWSPDGKRIASAGFDGTVQVWDAADGSHVYTYRGRDFGSPAANTVTGVAWSPDGRRIASSQGGLVEVWDAISGSTISTHQAHSILIRMAWSPDGKRIASADSDYGYVSAAYVKVWDAASGSTISTYQRYYGEATTPAWSPDGKRIAAGYDDGAVRIWDAS